MKTFPKREFRLNTRFCQTKHCSGVISSSDCSVYGESLRLPPIMGGHSEFISQMLGVTGTHSWRSRPRLESPGDIGEDTTATRCQDVQPGRNCTPESRAEGRMLFWIVSGIFLSCQTLHSGDERSKPITSAVKCSRSSRFTSLHLSVCLKLALTNISSFILSVIHQTNDKIQPTNTRHVL